MDEGIKTELVFFSVICSEFLAHRMMLPPFRANCFPPPSGICGLTLKDAPRETANLLDQPFCVL